MAKFYGNIGFAELVETAPDVWVEQITERAYYGDIVQNYRRLDSDGEVNDDVVISNKISIVADPYANEKIHAMRYVYYMNTKWKVSNVDIQYPRLILSIGGEYHGEDEREPQQDPTPDPW